MNPALLELVRVNSLLAGLIITAGLYFQCFKIFKTKSAADLSGLLIFSLLYNEISWFIYGLGIAEWPIVVLTLVTFPAEIAILVGYLKYGRRI